MLVTLAPVAGQYIPAASDAFPAVAEVDRLETLVPRTARSEAEQDQLDAIAHYSQARLHVKRGEREQALRHLERAWRCDPERTALLAEIVSLAFEMRHGDEAVRYSVLAAERDPHNALLLRRLAAYLSQQREWQRALGLYERAEQLEPADPQRPLDLAQAEQHAAMGRLYFQTDDSKKSAEQFALVRKALEDPASALSPDAKKLILGKPEQSYSLWAESFLAAQRYDEAASLFKLANAALPRPAVLAFDLARVEAGRGNVEKALAHLDEYFEAHETTAAREPYDLLLALIQRTAPDKATAHARFTARLLALHQQDETNVPLVLALAGEQFAAGKLDEAAALYSAAIEREPTTTAYERLIEIYRRQGDLQKLLATAGTAMQDSASLASLGNAGKSIAADDALLRKLIESTRSAEKDAGEKLAPGKLFAMAMLAMEGKRFDDAEHFFAASLTEDKPKHSQVLVAWSLGMLVRDQHARAAKVLQRAIDEGVLFRGEGGLYYLLSGSLAMDDQPEAALRAIKKAMAAEPGNISYESRLGWILYHADQLDDAARAYRNVLATFDSNHQSENARQSLRDVRLVLSNIAVKQDDFPAAVEWLEQVLDEFPEDATALNDLGYLWAERGLHLQRALRMTEAAVAVAPENLAFRDSLGWAYYQLGRYDDALRELLVATSGDAPDGTVLEHLGDAHAKLNQTSQARAAWRRALAAFKKSNNLEKIQSLRFKVQSKNIKP
jgi:tetratricopeptide (TPR) repeat protein